MMLANVINLADRINQAFVSPMSSFTPLPPLHALSPHLVVFDYEDICTETSVFLQLQNLNPQKEPGPDELPTWVLKENADVLAKPVNEILNTSFRECSMPSCWKMANVTPLSKQRPVSDVNLHLRPISLTPILSKVAEEVVVERYIKLAVLKIIDPRQFGRIPKSSTTMALIALFHYLSSSIDGNGTLARLAFLDFREAFDLVDHNIVISKLQTLCLPAWVVTWVTDFLTERQQRVKLRSDVYSSWVSVPAGVPQGTRLGPWLYLLMINDLSVTGKEHWKNVDDFTTAELVLKDATSEMQETINSIAIQSAELKFTLNEGKCKEMRIQFSPKANVCPPLIINHSELELVHCAKVLGAIISNDLKWNRHIE